MLNTVSSDNSIGANLRFEASIRRSIRRSGDCSGAVVDFRS
jgi:hypothetical protein